MVPPLAKGWDGSDLVNNNLDGLVWVEGRDDWPETKVENSATQANVKIGGWRLRWTDLEGQPRLKVNTNN